MDPRDEHDLKQAPDWDRHQYVGEGQGEPPEDDDNPMRDTTDEMDAPGKVWNKEEWVGEGQRGRDETSDEATLKRREGMSRSDMKEGESGLSGHEHPPGESHWAQSNRRDTDMPGR